MGSNEIECNSGEKSKYSISEKIAIMTKMGIDYLGNGKSIEEQKKTTEKLIKEITSNKELLVKLDKIEDSFWDEAKKGLLIYEDWASIKEEQNLRTTKQYCKNEKFTTLSGEEIVIEEAKSIPTLVKQKKKRVIEDWEYRI